MLAPERAQRLGQGIRVGDFAIPHDARLELGTPTVLNDDGSVDAHVSGSDASGLDGESDEGC